MPVITTGPNSYWSYDREFFRPHPILGYAATPGSFGGKMVVDGRELSFQTIVGDDGFRATRPLNTPKPAGRKIWLFGCSITYGWAVDTEKTFPWLLQEAFPDDEVRNFGVNAYGQIHNLIQLSHLLKEEKPAVVVFVYTHKHNRRNVAAPSFLKGLAKSRHYPEQAMTLKAGLTPDGKLYKRTIPLITDLLDKIDPALIEPDDYYSDLVTREIFNHVDQLSGQHGFKRIAALLDGTQNYSNVPISLREKNWTTVDLALPQDERYTNTPIDGHPNAVAHKIYADRLQSVIIRELLPSA